MPNAGIRTPPTFVSFTHQTINTAKVRNKSVDEIFLPLLEIIARLVGLSRGKRSSFLNPQFHVYRTRSVPSTMRNACYLSHDRIRNHRDVIGWTEPFYLVTSLDHMWVIRSGLLEKGNADLSEGQVIREHNSLDIGGYHSIHRRTT
jgi:hypothetical protein